jgi:hypothetical protein
LFAHIDNLDNQKSEIKAELLDKRDAIKTIRDSLGKVEKEIETFQREKVSQIYLSLSLLATSISFTSEAEKYRIGIILHWL